MKILLGIALALGIAAAAYGAAASLIVTSANLQAGGDTNLICDTDGVQTSWNVQWANAPTPDYYVGTVNVGGIDGACPSTSTVVVTLTASNGNFLAQQSTTVGSPSVNFKPAEPGVVLASDVYDIHVAIFN